MKALLINGSPHGEGNTARALKEVSDELERNGIATETIHIGNLNIPGCKACGACNSSGKCIFADKVNEVSEKLDGADALIVGSPVYYASPNGTLLSFLDRLFRSSRTDKTMKVGASVAVCRRGGASATFDVLNKYFTISGMPVVSSQYWNSVHGGAQGEASADAEGLQTMRTLARNAAFLVKSIALGKESIGLPEKEAAVKTSLIRPDLL